MLSSVQESKLVDEVDPKTEKLNSELIAAKDQVNKSKTDPLFID